MRRMLPNTNVMPAIPSSVVIVKKAESDTAYNHVFDIRTRVFVEEQKVAQDDEYDGLDNVSTLYVAYINELPAGTARWRRLPSGAVRFERMAVLPSFRRKGVGEALLKRLLEDVPAGVEIIIHAQVFIVPLFEQYGFVVMGEPFEEVGIIHRKMVYRGNLA